MKKIIFTFYIKENMEVEEAIVYQPLDASKPN